MKHEIITADMAYVKYEGGWGAEPFPPTPETHFYDLVKQTVYRHPLKTALISLGKKISYREMDELSDRLATALASLGVKKGDRVAVILPNTAQSVIAFHAIIKAGAVSVPCNVMFKAEEFIYILNDAGVEIVFCLDLLCGVIEGIKAKTKVKQIISVHPADISDAGGWIPPLLAGKKMDLPNTLDFTSLIEKYPPAPLKISINPRKDTALMIYTAGTTGAAKGVMETHYNMVSACLAHSHVLGLDYNDINLQILPMFHIGGYYLCLHSLFYKGGTVAMVPSFDPGEFLKMVAGYGVNTLVAPPTMYIALLNHPDFAKYDFKGFRVLIAAGAPVPAALQDSWLQKTGVELSQGWGMTEANAGAIVNLVNKKKLDSIGVPINGEVKIINKEGKMVKRGEIGEILYRGPQVAKGYWNKPKETRESFDADGWLHTGDAGYVSEDGFVYFVERIKDLIIASGYNIAPFDVESVILTHPAVREVAVIGMPDEYRGETVKAFVVLKEEFREKTSAEDIMEFCKDKMATYKRPRIVEFTAELPKSAVGKVLKRVLREEQAGKK